jgi:hypothetical protein
VSPSFKLFKKKNQTTFLKIYYFNKKTKFFHRIELWVDSWSPLPLLCYTNYNFYLTRFLSETVKLKGQLAPLLCIHYMLDLNLIFIVDVENNIILIGIWTGFAIACCILNISCVIFWCKKKEGKLISSIISFLYIKKKVKDTTELNEIQVVDEK